MCINVACPLVGALTICFKGNVLTEVSGIQLKSPINRTPTFGWSFNQSINIYLLKLGKITCATEQNEQDSNDNDITDSCP